MLGYATHGMYANCSAPQATVGLTTLAKVKSVLGIATADTASDTRLNDLILAVTDAMAQVACCRKWHFEQGIQDFVSGYGDFRLLTPRAPITAVTAVEVLNTDGTVAFDFDTDTFRIEDADAGILYRPSTWTHTAGTGQGIRLGPVYGTEQQSIRVTYSAGYVTPQQSEANPALSRTLPYDLEQAAIESVTFMFNRDGRDTSIISKSTDEVSTTWNASPQSSRHILTPAAITTAEAYKRCI